MFRASKFIKICQSNTLILAVFAVLIVGLYFTTKLRKQEPKCPYTEPIDVVYTWVNGSDPRFQISLQEHFNADDEVDSSKQRYEDKNELRFSLRSLEKYAPWINHVYIVTNGQIPYWLNLDCKQVTLVTHEEIFRDKSNLPTFSSPAIESNLHRIPGLSKKFIYFNDDIFVGQQLYPEDFYTLSKGYNIFLSYVLPNCASSCPWMYVGDGECDSNCNNVACQFDGNDCNGETDDIPLGELTQEESSENYPEEVEILRERPNSIEEFTRKRRSLNNSIKHRFLKNKTPIDKLVKEHNRKVIFMNKKFSRKRRNLYKSKGGIVAKFDGFLESLQYTQKLFNNRYGFKSRNVPAHAPIFLDRDILQLLNEAFVTELELTESNRFRHHGDMQFAFSYYYFLILETIKRSTKDIFDEFDTDNSGTWSDREIRNLLAKTYELPLSYEVVDHFEGMLLNCSEFHKYPEVTTHPYERYIDSKLPTITKEMVIDCMELGQFLKAKYSSLPKYKYNIIKNADKSYATFKMLVSNVTNVVINLDEIRSSTKKFVCLNDNLDESKSSENDLIRAILYDFYLSLFPHVSKFELPEHSRNRFLHVNDLRQWKRSHYIVKIILTLAILSLIIATFFNVFKKGCCKVFGDLFR